MILQMQSQQPSVTDILGDRMIRYIKGRLAEIEPGKAIIENQIGMAYEVNIY